MAAAFTVYKDMKLHNIKLHETVYSSLIRCCCVNDRPDDALLLYNEMLEQTIVPKLRTVSSLLEAFERKGDATQAFAVYNDARHKYEVPFTEREFCAMLKLSCATCDRRFYSVLSAMVDEIMWLESEETVQTITKWFTTPDCVPHGHKYTVCSSAASVNGVVDANGECLRSIDISDEVRSHLLNQLDTFAVVRDPGRNVKLNNKVKDLHASQKEAVAARDVAVMCVGTTLLASASAAAAAAELSSSADSSCSRKRTLEETGEVENEAVADIHTVTATDAAGQHNDDSCGNDMQTVHAAAAAKKQKQQKKSVFHDESARIAAWESYKAWLEEHAAKPSHAFSITGTAASVPSESGFDVILDGANIGYFKQNFAGAPLHVDHAQLDKMVSYLQSLGHRPMIFLHARHLEHRMVPTETAREYIQGWKDRQVLYVTPKGFNDDWFWLYAAAKYKLKVVTNDEMRDHHFQMLSHRWLPRWRERNQVHFSYDFPSSLKGKTLPTPIELYAAESTHIRTDGRNRKALRGANDNDNDNDSTDLAEASSKEQEVSVPSGKAEKVGTISGNGSNDGDIRSNSSNSNNNNDKRSETLNSSASSTVSPQPAYSKRVVSLSGPAQYSYQVQHILSAKYEGFYIPPLRPAAITSTGLGGGGTHIFGTGSGGVAVSNISNNTHCSENHHKTGGDAFSDRRTAADGKEEEDDWRPRRDVHALQLVEGGEWTCIFRPLPTGATTTGPLLKDDKLTPASVSSSQRPVPYVVILCMGVSGCGKSTVCCQLAQKLKFSFVDADQYHSSENVSKMSCGEPLTDEDRQPWLECLSGVLFEAKCSSVSAAHPSGIVLACSALKAQYRKTILSPVILSNRDEKNDQVRISVLIVHLTGSEALLSQRLTGRDGHFMSPTLLASQFKDLEPPTEEEWSVSDDDATATTAARQCCKVINIDVSAHVEYIVDRIASAIY